MISQKEKQIISIIPKSAQSELR